MKLLIATKNPGKLREIAAVFGNEFEIISLSELKNVPEVEENGRTFEENSLIKAKFYYEFSGIPAVADDGGIKIDILNGEPGVKSRRWPGHEASDDELIKITLDKLKGIPINKRTAHLVTVGTYYDGKNKISESGSIDGYIIEKYDGECIPGYPFRSLFIVPGFKKLYRDLTEEEHEAINHRKIVFEKLREKILNI